jgi:hypothetical protein
VLHTWYAGSLLAPTADTRTNTTSAKDCRLSPEADIVWDRQEKFFEEANGLSAPAQLAAEYGRSTGGQLAAHPRTLVLPSIPISRVKLKEPSGEKTVNIRCG